MAITLAEAKRRARTQFSREDEAVMTKIEMELDRCLIGHVRERGDRLARGLSVGIGLAEPEVGRLTQAMQDEIVERFRAAGWEHFEMGEQTTNYGYGFWLPAGAA